MKAPLVRDPAVRDHRSRGGERQTDNACRRKERKADHRRPRKRPTQRAAESGTQEDAETTHTEDRRDHTGNTQTPATSLYN